MWAILIRLLCFIFVVFTVGSVSALFLHFLAEASAYFFSHDHLILALPALGLATGLIYRFFGGRIPTTKGILHGITEKQALIPFLTAFFIFLFTVLSQLFGASTGRESSAVQFGAALADFWWDVFRKKFSFLNLSRESVIRSGLAAGFGAVFGVPWAGALFALEATPNRRWPLRLLPLCGAASFGAHWTALAWGATHKVYPSLIPISWDLTLVAKWAALGLIFGLVAKLFLVLLLAFEKNFFMRIPWTWLRPFVGGLLVAGLTLLFRETRYNGLGLSLIDSALSSGIQTWDFAWKGLFTILSSASGLKGGEVTPLMAIGASLGAVVAGWLSLPSLYAASLGLVSVFASASHIPWTGAVMAWELFGFEAFLPTFIVCWLAHRVLGVYGLFAAGK